MLKNLDPLIKKELQTFIKNNPEALESWKYSEDIGAYDEYDLSSPSICLLNILLMIQGKIPIQIIRSNNKYLLSIDHLTWADLPGDFLFTPNAVKNFLVSYFLEVYGDAYSDNRDFDFLKDGELLDRLLQNMKIGV